MILFHRFTIPDVSMSVDMYLLQNRWGILVCLLVSPSRYHNQCSYMIIKISQSVLSLKIIIDISCLSPADWGSISECAQCMHMWYACTCHLVHLTSFAGGYIWSQNAMYMSSCALYIWGGISDPWMHFIWKVYCHYLLSLPTTTTWSSDTNNT